MRCPRAPPADRVFELRASSGERRARRARGGKGRGIDEGVRGEGDDACVPVAINGKKRREGRKAVGKWDVEGGGRGGEERGGGEGVGGGDGKRGERGGGERRKGIPVGESADDAGKETRRRKKLEGRSGTERRAEKKKMRRASTLMRNIDGDAGEDVRGVRGPDGESGRGREGRKVGGRRRGVSEISNRRKDEKGRLD